uniref:Fission, mitochondrial 1 n=1 Tax=Microcebus murinus TaxID=30608 RepID=A0A8C5Y9Q3_MICMU
MEAVLSELVSVDDLVVRPGRVLRRVGAAAQGEQRGAAGLCLLPGCGELPAQEGPKVCSRAAADRAPEQPGQGTGTAH